MVSVSIRLHTTGMAPLRGLPAERPRTAVAKPPLIRCQLPAEQRIEPKASSVDSLGDILRCFDLIFSLDSPLFAFG